MLSFPEDFFSRKKLEAVQYSDATEKFVFRLKEREKHRQQHENTSFLPFIYLVQD